jgi:hypothetical protein
MRIPIIQHLVCRRYPAIHGAILEMYNPSVCRVIYVLGTVSNDCCFSFVVSSEPRRDICHRMMAIDLHSLSSIICRNASATSCFEHKVFQSQNLHVAYGEARSVHNLASSDCSMHVCLWLLTPHPAGSAAPALPAPHIHPPKGQIDPRSRYCRLRGHAVQPVPLEGRLHDQQVAVMQGHALRLAA